MRKPRNPTVRTIVVGTEICAGPPVILNQRKIERDIEGVVLDLI
jgi:hypothetical protein